VIRDASTGWEEKELVNLIIWHRWHRRKQWRVWRQFRLQQVGHGGTYRLNLTSRIWLKRCSETESDLTHEGIPYREIRAFVRNNFIYSSFQFCPQTCNKVAHAMAALGASQVESHLFWQEMIPNSVTILVASEYAEPVSWNRGVPVKKSVVTLSVR
jgi:hypothetical protein